MCFIVMCFFLYTYSSLLFANSMFVYINVSKFVSLFGISICVSNFSNFSVLVDVFIGLYSHGFISRFCKAKTKTDMPR